MNIKLIIAFIFCIGYTKANAQPAKAKTYYYAAQNEYKKGDRNKTITNLYNAEKALGHSTAVFEALRIKAYLLEKYNSVFTKTSNYTKYAYAKAALEKFYLLNPSDKLIKEMLPYVQEVEKGYKEYLQAVKADNDNRVKKAKGKVLLEYAADLEAKGENVLALKIYDQARKYNPKGVERVMKKKEERLKQEREKQKVLREYKRITDMVGKVKKTKQTGFANSYIYVINKQVDGQDKLEYRILKLNTELERYDEQEAFKEFLKKETLGETKIWERKNVIPKKTVTLPKYGSFVSPNYLYTVSKWLVNAQYHIEQTDSKKKLPKDDRNRSRGYSLEVYADCNIEIERGELQIVANYDKVKQFIPVEELRNNNIVDGTTMQGETFSIKLIPKSKGRFAKYAEAKLSYIETVRSLDKQNYFHVYNRDRITYYWYFNIKGKGSKTRFLSNNTISNESYRFTYMKDGISNTTMEEIFNLYRDVYRKRKRQYKNGGIVIKDFKISN